jgi:hypothetical protein
MEYNSAKILLCEKAVKGKIAEIVPLKHSRSQPDFSRNSLNIKGRVIKGPPLLI